MSAGLDWINPLRDMDKWWVLVNTVMNLRVNCGEVLD
jgi:hypothetical protein